MDVRTHRITRRSGRGAHASTLQKSGGWHGGQRRGEPHLREWQRSADCPGGRRHDVVVHVRGHQRCSEILWPPTYVSMCATLHNSGLQRIQQQHLPPVMPQRPDYVQKCSLWLKGILSAKTCVSGILPILTPSTGTSTFASCYLLLLLRCDAEPMSYVGVADMPL